MTQPPNGSGRVSVEPPAGRRRRSRGGATPSRLGSLWVASVLFAVVLLLLLIFVLQNGQDAKISYLGAHGSLPQGVALLLAAVFGILLVALPGTARIIQLRIRDRRHRGGPAHTPPFDVTPPATNPPSTSPPVNIPLVTDPLVTDPLVTDPLTGNALDANAQSTNPPTSPVASPPGPPAQAPPADAR